MAYGLVQFHALITQKADVKKRKYAFQRQFAEKPNASIYKPLPVLATGFSTQPLTKCIFAGHDQRPDSLSEQLLRL